MMVLRSLKVSIGKLELYSKDTRKPLGGFKCYHPFATTIPGCPVLPLLLLNSCLSGSLAPYQSLGKAGLISTLRPHAQVWAWWVWERCVWESRCLLFCFPSGKSSISSKDAWNEDFPPNIQEWGSDIGRSKHGQISLRLESLLHAALRLFHITKFHRTHFGKFCDFFFSPQKLVSSLVCLEDSYFTLISSFNIIKLMNCMNGTTQFSTQLHHIFMFHICLLFHVFVLSLFEDFICDVFGIKHVFDT